MKVCKQKSTYDCMLACITMLVQRSYDDLWPEYFKEKIEEKQGTHGQDITEAFKLVGLHRDVDYLSIPIPDYTPRYTIRALLFGRRAIIQVRSLNYKDAGHFVYWDGKALYDPSNMQVYRWLAQVNPEYIWVFNEIKGESVADE